MNKHIRKMGADLECLASDLQSLASESNEAARDTAGIVRGGVKQVVRSGRRTLRLIQRGTRNGVKQTRRAVHDHPIASVGAALGVGIAVAAIVARRQA